MLRRKRSLESPRKRRRRIRKLRFLCLLGALGLVCTVAFAFGLVTALGSELPALDPANPPRNQENGYIYASDEKTVLAVLRGEESRVVVEPEEIAPIVKQAIVAVEDRRYWEHRGVDIKGILRAIWADIRNKEIVQGGSTITQQFVKNTRVEDERTVSRKLKEAALAWQLERAWDKDRILTAYLNTVYFGNGAYGIEMAARVYFQKHARDLTLIEAALLAAIPANPAAFDPVTNPRAARVRRFTVLQLMFDQGLITRGELLAASRTPLPDPKRVRLPGTRGPAQYFVEYVKQQLIPYYGSGAVFGGGLKIYTSIDLRLQRAARNAIGRWLTKKNGPAAALVAIDPRDGSVRAMVGGPSFTKSQFNLAVQGKRQSGSAFKPFVLATALRQGIAPQTVFTSRPTVINLGDKLWSVHNYEGNYLGAIDLERATIYSDNSVYAQLTAQVGPANVRETAHALGIVSPLDDYFAIGLGVEAVNPLEMARAFGTIANGGSRVDGSLLGDVPRAVLAVRHRDGLDSNEPVKRRVLAKDDAALVNLILQKVVEQGTGKRARLDDRPAAGKTGTTENYGDAWFVGYTPQLVTAVWVGYPNTLKPMLKDYEGGPVAGGTFPALIWRTFTTYALRLLGERPKGFPSPSLGPVVSQRVAYRNGHWVRDNGRCQDVRQIVYFAGSEPSETARCRPNEVDVPKVIGAKVADAEARLAGTPLQAEVITRAAEPGERLGVVVDQFPKSGTLVSFDTVKIVVPEAVHGTVPRVVGLTIAKAQERLARKKLAALIEAVAGGEPSVVLAQTPQAGVAAGPNMTVSLVVGRG